VRAVAEVMSTGRAHLLWSLLQSVLWMAALTGLLVLAFGLAPRPTQQQVHECAFGQQAQGCANVRHEACQGGQHAQLPIGNTVQSGQGTSPVDGDLVALVRSCALGR